MSAQNKIPTNLLITSALKDELKPIQKVLAEKLPADMYQQIQFAITGIGGVKTVDFLANLIPREIPFILNIGTAGALSSELTVGDVIYPEAFIKWPEMEKIVTGANEFILATTAHPVIDKKTKQSINNQCGAMAVDMEAYYQALWCQNNKIRFQSIKVISDLAEFMTIAKFRRCLGQVIGNLERPVIERVSDYLRNE